jgi:ATP-dependent Clp endopeptidase proteolytic subunit ClpP
MKSWYSIKALKDDEYEVAIYDEIGFWGITAKQFLTEFKKIPPSAKVFLRINSPGGDVFDGTAIFNVIKRHEGEVISTIDGLAASMASVIALAADKVVMPDNAFMMIHNPWGISWGDAEDLRDYADILDKIKSQIANTYAAKSGKDIKEINDMMDAETWLTGTEAKEAGFVDEVTESVKLAARFNQLNHFVRTPAALATALPPPAPVTTETPAPASQSPADIDSDGLAAKNAKNTNRIQILDSDEDLKKRMLDAARAEFQTIVDLCNKAGVTEMAGDFLTGGMPLDQIKARLADADAIRGACVAIGLPGGKEAALKRASGYIKAGATVAEVRDQLNKLKTDLDAVEIDNKFGPNALATAIKPPVIIDMAAIRKNWQSGGRIK